MKKRLLPLALALGLSLVLPLPALGAEAPARTYEEAVGELKNTDLYAIESALDTDLCSVFLYRRVGTPHIAYHYLTLIYKAGAPLGEGVAVDLPLHIDSGFWGTTLFPDKVELSEDEKTLAYTYFSPDYGTDIYTVNLTTGEVTTSYVPPTQEQIISWFIDNETTVETRLEAPNDTVILWCSTIERQGTQAKDYYLYLFSKEPEKSDPEAWFRRLVLPSTTVVGSDYPQYPTDRAPDSLALSEDGTSLTYVYRFEDTLSNADGELLHDAGIYTYTAELASGELKVDFEKDALLPVSGLEAEGTTFVDVAPSDWFAPYVDVCVEAGLMKGTGNGMFSPGELLTGYECSVLALRLYDLGRGGDGSFEKAPWDWGYATLTLPDGSVTEGYLSDNTTWAWTMLGRADSGHLGFRLNTEKERERGRSMDYQTVVLTVSGVEYAGELHLSGPGFLYFDPADRGDYDAIQNARFVPNPNAWWRDAWYYAEQNGLKDILMHGGSGSRWGFANAMAAVTDLPAINEIPGLPDTGDPDIRKLYRAGVLTGSDEYGTFHSYSTMTRAEAAAICARILRPELRLEFSLKPLETYENYTLTYLREDGVREGGPYCAQHSMDLVVPDPHTLMRLDGVELTLPEGYEVETVGDGLAGLVKWDGNVYHFGLMDSQGRFRAATRKQVYENPRLARFPYDSWVLYNGYESRGAFHNEKGEQVTPWFDWLGVINPDGAGFVGMDGKIYRIQFEK